MEFKENLYRIRKEKGLSQEELAMLCGVSRQAISKWENGSANPDMENLKTLSRALNISVDELLGNDSGISKPDKEVVYVSHHYMSRYRYQSKLRIFGLPLIDVNLGSFRTEDNHWRVAKGVIAIGNIAAGIFSLGLLSLGLVSMGVLTIGVLLGFGALSLGYMAVGALAIGYISMGAMAIGVYSLGALSIGFHVSVGAIAYGDIAIGSNPMGTHVYHLQGHRSCFIDAVEYNQLRQFLDQESLPKIIEAFLRSIPKC